MSFSLWSFIGEEFQLSHSEWYSLLSLIAQTEILPYTQISDMSWNYCEIEIDGKTAAGIAEALEKIVKDKFDNQKFKTTDTHCGSSMFFKNSQLRMNYQLDYGFVREFIEFCKSSDGFEVC